MSRANRQVSARESSSSADRRTVFAAPRWRGRTEAALRSPYCARHRQRRCRCSRPTLDGARGLETKSHATSIVWCGAAPDGGACPSCVAVHRRRLRHDPSDQTPEQQTWWDQKVQRAARTVRDCGPRQPHSVTRQGRSQSARSRSGGNSKRSDQAGLLESS